MRPRLVWVLAGIATAGAITFALTSLGDPYPIGSRPGASQSNPTRTGAPVQAVVLFVEPRPGDRIELLGAEPVGLVAGARTRLFLSRPEIDAEGNRVIGDALEPIAGAVIEAPADASPGPDHAVGIVAELTPERPGIFELTSIRLRFRINGGAEQAREGISVIWTVCADDPAPTTCE